MNNLELSNAAMLAAIAGGQDSTEGGNFVKYQGFVPVYITAVNPSLEELKKLYPERTFENAPEYIKKKEGESNIVLVNVHVRTNHEHKDANGIQATGVMTFILRPEPFINKEKTKVQVINAYGDTAWVTNEQFQTGDLPDYAKKGAYATPYRAALRGEEDLIHCLKKYLAIPNYRNYKDGVWSQKEASKLPESLCCFEPNEMESFFKGNFTKLQQYFKARPTNQIRTLWGVRVNDGKEYQDIITRKDFVVSLSESDPKKIDKAITEAKQGGAFESTLFNSHPFTFQEYSVTPTEVTPQVGQVPTTNPFASNAWAQTDAPQF